MTTLAIMLFWETMFSLEKMSIMSHVVIEDNVTIGNDTVVYQKFQVISL